MKRASRRSSSRTLLLGKITTKIGGVTMNRSFMLLGLLPLLSLLTPAPSAERDADVVALVRGNNQAAIDLYSRLREKEGNLFLSPYSISSAVAMVQAGARGETAREIAAALRFPQENERLMAGFGKLNRQINGD